jgi:3-oxoacyl-[acyl-carrier protein] reductase
VEARAGRLDGKVAFVTGSSRGIGAAIARLFARAGAKVAVHGRDTAAVSRVVTEIQSGGGVAMPVVADVTDFDQLVAAQQAIQQRFGAVDVLVANAGGSLTPPMPLEEITEANWRATVDGNLTATFLTVKCFLPAMKERRSGTIITISSAAGRVAHPRAPIQYSVAKAGIELLTQDVAAQAGAFNIRANCIAPDTILTEKNEQRIPADQRPALVAAHHLKRLGMPEDVAEAALFLASEQSSWITGVILDVAGGAVMLR